MLGNLADLLLFPAQTSIFEWSESIPDLAFLLRGPGSLAAPTASTPAPFSPHFALALISLAEERNFDGFLINVEVPLDLGIGLNGEPWSPWAGEMARAMERARNAERLRQWVAFLRAEGETRMKKLGRRWEIVW